MTIGWSTDFIVADGEAPAAPQLDRVQASNAAWVLVEREGGRWRYVFSKKEVLGHSHLRWLFEQGTDFLAIPLKDALGLHEVQESGQVGDSDELKPRPEIPGAPCSARYVEIDAAGRPSAVGGTDVIRAQGQRAMPPAKRAPVLARFRSREAPPMPDPAAPAAAPAAPADDEGTTPVRHPSIESEGALQAGAPIVVVVDLLRQASATTQGGPLDLGTQAATWSALDIGVTLVSNDIDFDDRGRGTVTIRRNQTSIAERIAGHVHAGLSPGAAIEIQAQFWDGTRCSGQATRRLLLAGGAAAVAPQAAPPQLPTPVQDAVRIDPSAEKADLTIYIALLPGAARGLMHWRMVTPHFDELPPALDGFTDLGNDTASEAAAMFNQFAKLEDGKHRARIEGFGETLWSRAPAEFRELYWALHDHYQRPLTIQFISADPHLPWELMRPFRKNEVHPPLALRHAVARWISKYQGFFRNDLAAGRMVTIAPHYKSSSLQLPVAEATAAKLVAQFGAERIAGTLAEMRKLLEVPPADPVAMLYFTGHGLFAADAVNASAIKLEDGNLAVDEVARREVTLGERWGTLVFFNACEVGATATALGAVGGWAEAFAQRQFRAFIAPLWAVEEDAASTATEELMNAILTDREPIGAALRDLRAKFGDISPTFYSYLLYGDVTARLRR